VSVSAEAPPAREPEDPRPPAAGQRAGSGSGSKARPARPLVVTGGIAAFAAAASGLAALTTLTAIGWITAPHVGLGTGLGGVLRTAALLWLVAHHVGHLAGDHRGRRRGKHRGEGLGGLERPGLPRL